MYNPPYSGNPPTAPSPPPPPPPEEAEEAPATPRYPYLVSRLRNRQITMEEATELFAIQRQQVRSLVTRTNALVAAATSSPATVRVPRAPPRPSTPAMPVGIENVDPWGEGLLFLALGAGILAALLKRSQGPTPGGSRPPTPGAPSTGRS